MLLKSLRQFALLFVALTVSLNTIPKSICHGDEPPSIEFPKARLEPFLEQHCLRCHGEDEENGDFRVDTLAWSVETDADAEKWQDVLDVLNAGSMPPESEPKPEKNSLIDVLSVLTKGLTKARATLSDAGTAVPIRRLNKREYINTIRHLFGLNLNENAIPEDIRGENFDTLGESQFFDVAAFETYLELGNKISREGLKWSGQRYDETKTTHIEAESLDRRGTLNKISGYSDYPQTQKGRYLFSGRRELRDISIKVGPDPRAFYRIKIHAGLAEDTHPLRRAVVVSESSGVAGIPGTRFGTLRIHGTLKKPETEEIVIPRRALGYGKKSRFNITESKPNTNFRGFQNYLKDIGDKDPLGSIWVDWVEVEGPLYPSRQNAFGDLIAETTSREVTDLRNIDVRELLTKFATEAFRRQEPEPQYIDALVDHYDQLQIEGVSDVDAISKTMGVVLASPGFLYLEEATQGSRRKLTPRSFATRLAYFLWSSPPDDELYELAETGNIFKPATLKRQVGRMLKDEKADSFFEGFMSQWAELERLDGVTVNLKEYPSYTTGYQLSIVQEPIEFFKVLVRENLSVDQLIDSDFVVVNSFLADHYNLRTKKRSNDFSKIRLPKDDPRGGMITQAAFLTMGSDGNRTSPVIRGALLSDKLLNTPPPPPPPNVPELAEASDVPVSNRQIVELHQKQTACASCHKRIDPIGFGLENFDVVGQWRDFEKVGDKEIRIKARSTLVSGVKFSGLGELKELLTSQRHRLAKEMIESLLAYGLGRNKSFSDLDAIVKIFKQSREQNFQMRDMIIGIVNSEPFQSK